MKCRRHFFMRSPVQAPLLPDASDMADGKAEDDGYRGVHMYFQMSSFHHPIEIQYNTFYDNGRQGGERQ